MTTLAPVSVALKFGFLAVLYLFLLWVARSALRDLRGRGDGSLVADAAGSQARRPPRPTRPACTRPRRSGRSPTVAARAPRLVVERAPGHDPGMIYDLDGDLVLGRGERAEIRLEDPFASSRHARDLRAGQHRRDRGSGLDQRHVPERGAAARLHGRCTPATGCGSATANSRSRSTDMLRVAEQYAATRHRPPAAGQRGLAAGARAAVRRRRRDGRRAGRRGRFADRGGVLHRTACGDAAEPGGGSRGDGDGGQRAHPRAVAQPTPSRPGMGTTLTAVYVGEREVAIAHVGDSRAYRLRDGELLRLTDDHSLVDELIRQGRLTPEEAVDHPQRSVITRALGPGGGGRGRHALLQRTRGRRVPAVQRRPDDDARARTELAEVLGAHATPARRGRGADRGGQRGGRTRQHHGGPAAPGGASARQRDRPTEGARLPEPARARVRSTPRRPRHPARPRPRPRAASRAARARRQGTALRRPRGGAACVRRWWCSAWSARARIWRSQSVYFIGTNARGLVTLYRGRPLSNCRAT